MENCAYLNKIGLGLAILTVINVPLTADSPRTPAELITSYSGTHRDSYDQAFDRVRILARQAQLETSVALGLIEYREGFRYPLQIQFEDSAPRGLENTLAYVRYSAGPQGFRQQLVINLEEMQQASQVSWVNLERVFYHEMTHAVLNDSIGGLATTRIPRWVQEGLAQYVSKEGESRLKDLGEAVYRSQVRPEWFYLERPPAATAYPAFYLAIRYLENKFTINAVQALVRHLIEGRPIEEAIHESTALSLEEFKTKVRDYSVETIRDLAKYDGQIR